MTSVNVSSPKVLVTTSAILVSLSTALVVIRCVVRFGLIRKPGWDDGLMIGGILSIIAYLVALLVACANGIGYSMFTLAAENLVTILKATVAIEVLYYAIIFFIKSSIVAMYLRFAVGQRFRQLCHATLALLSVFFVICVVCTLAQCQPLSKFWTLDSDGKCINTTAFFYFTSGFNIITDCWILVLPIPTLRSIQIGRREKIVLFGIFGIGLFATALSCVRLQSIYTYTLAADPILDGVPVNLWSMIEINSAVVCANIPALKPLFKPQKLLDTMKASKGSISTNQEGYVRDSDGRWKNSEMSRAGSSASRARIHEPSASGLGQTPSSEDSIDMDVLPAVYLKV